MASIYLENGQRYEGDVNDNGLPNGKGTLYYTNGDVFEGWFDRGKPSSGHATLRRSNGEQISGDYGISGFSGDVTIRYPNGDEYQGGYNPYNNGVSGRGVLRYFNGDRFEGNFDGGRPTYGKYYFSNGNVFEGTIKAKGYFEGKMTFTNGDAFIGQFMDAKPFGKGEIKYANGKRAYVEYDRGRFVPATTLKDTLQKYDTDDFFAPKKSKTAEKADYSPLLGAIGVLVLFVLDIILTFVLKDGSGLCRWLWLPIISMVTAFSSVAIIDACFPGFKIVWAVIGAIWGVIRGILVLIAYFAAASGWGIIVAIFFSLVMLILNSFAYLLGVFIKD